MSPFETFVSWAGIFSAVLALLALLQASWLSFKANQPAVAVRLSHSQANPELMHISIRNYGPTMAEGIRLESSERPMRRAYNGKDDPQELELFDREWTLAPGEEWRTFWGSYTECKSLNPGPALHGTASCEAQGRPWFWFFQRKRLAFPYVIDLAMYEGRTRMDEYTVHRVGKLLASAMETERLGNANAVRVEHFRPAPQTMEAIDRHMAGLQRGQDGAHDLDNPSRSATAD